MALGSSRSQLRLSDLAVPVAQSITCLGSGAFSRVVAMRVVASGETVAVKQVDRSKIADPKLVLNEKAILMSLQHPAVVELLGTDKDSSHVYFIFKICSNGPISRHIEAQIAGFELTTIKTWAMQTLLGLRYLHDERGIVHGDIKPANLLLDERWNVNISDFGFASEIANLNKAEREIGTRIYWAPEQFQKYKERRSVKLTGKIDIWAFGITFFQVAFLDHPFRARSDEELAQKVINDDVAFPSGTNQDLVQLLRAALKKAPQDRYQAADLLRLPIFTGMDGSDVFSSACSVPDNDDTDNLEENQSLFKSF